MRNFIISVYIHTSNCGDWLVYGHVIVPGSRAADRFHQMTKHPAEAGSVSTGAMEAAMVAITVYVILDIEYPRFGIIWVIAADRVD